MRLINIPINGGVSSLIPPNDAACWAIHMDEGTGEGFLLFRKKLLTETSFLTSLNAVREEAPSFEWTSCSSNPTTDTSGGVDPSAAHFCRIRLQKDEGTGRWVVIADRGMSSYLLSQNDLSSLGTRLPKQNDLTTAELVKLMASLKKMLGVGS